VIPACKPTTLQAETVAIAKAEIPAPSHAPEPDDAMQQFAQTVGDLTNDLDRIMVRLAAVEHNKAVHLACGLADILPSDDTARSTIRAAIKLVADKRALRPRTHAMAILMANEQLPTPRPQRSLFLPTARQLNWLLVVGVLALGEALYLRYQAMENASMSLACQGGLDTWLCAAFRLVAVLYPYEAFGGLALAAALLNLMRPSLVLLAVATVAGAFGVVLHNADLGALAFGVLILGLARPAPAPR
jgi:hypothetical protein